MIESPFAVQRRISRQSRSEEMEDRMKRLRALLSLALVAAIGLISSACTIVEAPLRGVYKGGEYLFNKADEGGDEVMFLTGLKDRPSEVTLAAPLKSYTPTEIFASHIKTEDSEAVERLTFLVNQQVDPKEWPAWKLRAAVLYWADQEDGDGLASREELQALEKKLTQKWAEGQVSSLLMEMNKASSPPPTQGSAPPASVERTKTDWRQ